MSDLENINIDELLPSPDLRCLPDFELKTLKTITFLCGKSIVKHYEVNNRLSDKYRNQLTDIIIRHIYLHRKTIRYNESLASFMSIDFFNCITLNTQFFALTQIKL